MLAKHILFHAFLFPTLILLTRTDNVRRASMPGIQQLPICRFPVQLTNLSEASCWLIDADRQSLVPMSNCTGFQLIWIRPPPVKYPVNRSIEVTFQFNLNENFYPWAFGTAVFSHIPWIRSATDVRQHCDSRACPRWLSNRTCCITHIDVHTQPLRQNGQSVDILCPFAELDQSGLVVNRWKAETIWMIELPGLNQPGKYAVFAQIVTGRLLIILSGILQATGEDFNVNLVNDLSATASAESQIITTAATKTGSQQLSPKEIAFIVLLVLTIGLCIPTLIYGVTYCETQRRKNRLNNVKPSLGPLILEPDQVDSVDPEENDTKISRTILATKPSQLRLAKVGDMIVAVKKVTPKMIQLTQDMLEEIEMVREFHHPNLTQLIGISLGSTYIHFYWEYCQKASLGSIIRRMSLPLNWTFRLSMLTDISNGLSFLHKRGIVHGRLSSNNCVVDGDWTCKLTDFGMDEVRFKSEYSKMETFLKNYDNIPYVATEYRDCPDLFAVPEMDIYSFGTLMSEIALRTDFHKEVGDVISPLAYQAAYPTSECFTEDPRFERGSAPKIEDYCELIKMCWEPTPIRPSAVYIRESLTAMNPRKISPSDRKMIIINEYSTRLEILVEERTESLKTEMKLTDQLLHSMLPKGVVAALRLGEHVPPEAFDQCTIYFSDIVGFTTISSKSTPFEVVALLNKLYSEFDEIIDRYDVYKVETIGDAYMVASGVPRRNGERHAIAVTDMSLDLVSVSHKFVIPHMPEEPLKIRVGLHSGPVCAGVVGLKMPRYCLFGDTVNTASRMESTGEAYKIHCSDATHEILERLGGFLFERRGTIEVKGKGSMQTWWVLKRMREEVEHDLCPLPPNWKKKLKDKAAKMHS